MIKLRLYKHTMVIQKVLRFAQNERAMAEHFYSNYFLQN